MSEYRRILDVRSLAPDQVQNRDEVWDAGAWRELVIQFRVVSAGSAGNLKLQHAAVNEEDAFTDLSTASIALNATGDAVVHITAFLRYVRWVTDSGVAGSPVAIVDAVGKGQ